MRAGLIGTAAVLALTLAGCRVSDSPEGNAASSPPAAQANDWPGFVNQFIEASFRADPGFAVQQGRHEFDGQIADLSGPAIDREVKRLKDAIAAAQGFKDDALTPEQRFERDYLVAVAKGQLFWVD